MIKSFPDWMSESSAHGGEQLLRALSNIYIGIAMLDLRTGSSVVLSAKQDEEAVGCEMPWDALLKRFVSCRVYEEDRARIDSVFSLSSLALFFDSETNEKSAEARCRNLEADCYEWVEMTATVCDREAFRLLVTTRNISEAKLQKRVLDQFLYHQNCDYFVLLDLKSNQYKFFDVAAGLLPVPAMKCADYMSDMLAYNNQYAVKSEVEKVNFLMGLENIRAVLEDRDEFSFTAGIITDSGEYRRAKIQFISFDRANKLVIISRSDVTQIYLEEKRRSEQLVHALRAAQRDQLTGLYNQTTTEEVVSQMLEAYQGELAAVMFIDVDNFKMVNDTLGHLRGNELLKGMAAFLKGLTSEDVIAGRVGGDEFLLYLSNAASMQEVYGTAQRICDSFNSFQELTAGLPISCSVGISLYPQDGLGFEVLVRKADQALYRAKRYGKNHYSLYSEELELHPYASALSEID